MCPVGGHRICRSDGTQCDGPLICALIAHYTDTLNRQQYYAGLPHLVIQAPLAQAVYEYGVSVLENPDLFRGDIAEDTHCQAWTGERMAGDEMLRQSQLTSDGTYLILEKQA